MNLDEIGPILAEVNRAFVRHRSRSVPRREITEPEIVFLVGITVIPRAFVEIERVTERIVLEFGGLPASALGPIEPPYEGLPTRTGDDLRPLAKLLKGVDPSVP